MYPNQDHILSITDEKVNTFSCLAGITWSGSLELWDLHLVSTCIILGSYKVFEGHLFLPWGLVASEFTWTSQMKTICAYSVLTKGRSLRVGVSVFIRLKCLFVVKRVPACCWGLRNLKMIYNAWPSENKSGRIHWGQLTQKMQLLDQINVFFLSRQCDISISKASSFLSFFPHF